jgi:para-aminobenzoate synthetase/4-amino-4-deoxychorismate lyase
VNAQTDASDPQITRIDSPLPNPARGVFETLLVLDGKPVELERHLERLESSVNALWGEHEPATARELILDCSGGLPLGRLRLDVVPAAAGTTATVKAVPVEEALLFPPWSRAIDLRPIAVPGGIGAHKWVDRRLLERAEADANGAVALILDIDGTLLEGSRSSLFLVRHGAIWTPAADGRLLPGVTRARVIEAARALGAEVHEEALPLDRLLEADEAFLTGAVRGIEPVRSCLGLREWRGGELTARLSYELRRTWLG